MKLWIDDVRPSPDDSYVTAKSVNEAKKEIFFYLLLGSLIYKNDNEELVLDIDHDAGDYAKDGGDYIKLLDWLERIKIFDVLKENNIYCAIHIHSMNPVGIENMRTIIRKNNWREI